MNYDFKAIEEKWQKRWVEEKSFKAVDFHPTKPKYYVLYEFCNISGNLHMGHLKGTIPADALARAKRLQGYNVLFPIGGDAFGLPAENSAIKSGINPRQFVADGMVKVMEQLKQLGLSFDWDRTICTSDPEYYKWTQWIFLQLFKHGKAYKEKAYVNYCPKCQTVLSNEDSQAGKCDRCGSDVIQVERNVWFLKMQEYAEKLLGNVERINMAENLKEAQRNWIDKSEGMQVKFDVVDDKGKKIDNLEIYTTCCETIYGITFLALAPENKLVEKLQPYIKNYDDVLMYRQKTALRSEFERISNLKEKTGCVLKGVYAINPINNKKVPLYLADFVLANYATGAVMAVPTHDQRDYDFAKAFNIPMLQVIEGDCSNGAVEKKEYLAKNSKLINSGEFSGMPVKEGKIAIAEKLVALGVGEKKVNYRMKDWSFNRQRYWGEPFPIVFCEHCGTVALDEKDLPLVLPEIDDYLPNANGDSPLSKVESFVNCSCPKCGRPAKRETDTMPNWAGSSWYWLRYTDPHNDKAFADFEKLKYWGSVDCYTGGVEHITRHVLYAFFWQNFLYEIGAVPSRDPFIRKMGSGLILDDQGKKMSKSSKNGVSPKEVIDKYGTDVARLHVHFLGGYEDNTPWTYDGITGITAFLDKVWNLQNMIKGDEISFKHEVELNKLIKKITEDIEDLKLNTCISSLMTFIKKIKEDGYITKQELRIFLILLNPLAPHITSEIYERVFNSQILDDVWPTYDKNKLVEAEVEIAVQINSKIIAKIMVPSDSNNSTILDIVKSDEKINSLLKERQILKEIVVPKRLVNIICK